ncbi:MAG: chemotaxis protein CheB [Methylomicrobium sp.]
MVVNKDNRQQVPAFPVVGIGASAGGIEALKSLFSTLPPRTGLAFVVVQHLLPEHPSYLAELIGKACVLPVCEAQNGMTLEPDHVYIIAPGDLLTLEGGVLRCCLFGGPGPSGIDLIDTFFESLAKTWGSQARAVVLSGTGTDGAAGAMLIKQAGGKVVVQDPETALYDGMPSAAIATGMVDHVLPVESIAQALLTGASTPSVNTGLERVENADVAESLDKILSLISRRSGFD